MTTLVIGDRNRLFAEALAVLLTQHGHTVVALAHMGADTVAATRAWRPELCVVERRFPDVDGLEVVGSIVDACEEVKVIVLTSDADSSSIGRALARGAVGYVHKSCGAAVLTESLRRIVEGEIVVDALSRGPVRRRPTEVPDVEWLARFLTSREHDCLELLVEGLGTTAMARRMGVATTTIRSHVQATLTKLGAHSRLEAAAMAVRYGLIDPVACGGRSKAEPGV
jgi:two-component system nitrate/nitrite response regulator NarL